MLAARAALRTGAGLVIVGVPEPVWPVAAAKLDEAMPHPLPAGLEGGLSEAAFAPALERMSHSDACLLGPGLGRNPETGDGGAPPDSGISRPPDSGRRRHKRPGGAYRCTGQPEGPGHRPHTPRRGFARLGGDLSSGDRLEAARRFAREHACSLILKGHRTITAFPDGNAYVNTTGNPGMSRGGSGDVLGGILWP